MAAKVAPHGLGHLIEPLAPFQGELYCISFGILFLNIWVDFLLIFTGALWDRVSNPVLIKIEPCSLPASSAQGQYIPSFASLGGLMKVLSIFAMHGRAI